MLFNDINAYQKVLDSYRYLEIRYAMAGKIFI
jgi:hypothetical protein